MIILVIFAVLVSFVLPLSFKCTWNR